MDSAPFVVDANVALKLFFEQPGSDKAEALFACLVKDSRTRLYVPDFFYAECSSALVLYVRQKVISPAAARKNLTDLLALGVHVVSAIDLTGDALELALSYGISGYDAFYVALSQQIKAPLVTADKGLVRALRGKPFQILALDGFELPSSSGA